MENSTYILVPNANGQQLQLPVATPSASVAPTLTKANAVIMPTINSAHATNPTVGKSVLNVRTIGQGLAGTWKSGDAVPRAANSQPGSVRLIVANSKDGFVTVPNYASLTSGGGGNSGAESGNGRATLVWNSNAGSAVQKIAPAAATTVNYTPSIPNGSLRTVIPPGGNKMPVGRTVPVGSFASSATAAVPKTTLGSVWGSLSSATSTTMSASVTSPSKQVIIQLAPDQLVRCV